MKSTILVLCLLLFGSASGATREISGVSQITGYRTLGEIRVWSFELKGTPIGNLASTLKLGEPLGGQPTYLLDEKLILDYNKAGSPLKMQITNDRLITALGYYLGDRMKLVVNEQKEELKLERDDENILGYITRGGKKISQERSFKANGFAIENNFLDQYELFWALRDVKVGDVVVDTIFSPQAVSYVPLEARIESFINLRVYNEVFDSVFVISYTQPQEQYHYFTPDKRLIKAVVPSQELKAYLDLVKKPTAPPPGQTAIAAVKGGEKRLPKLVGVYSLYLLFGGVAVALFAAHAFRVSVSYLYLFLGAVAAAVIPLAQVPLQTTLFENFFLPGVRTGGSPYFLGLWPALSAGLMQELIKAVLIFFMFRLKEMRRVSDVVALGALIGGGFGIVEACYLASQMGIDQVISVSAVLEKGFIVMFHAAGGAILGCFLFYSMRVSALAVILLVICNTLLRYSPIFASQGLAGPAMLSIVIAIIALTVMLSALLVIKKRVTTVK